MPSYEKGPQLLSLGSEWGSQLKLGSCWKGGGWVSELESFGLKGELTMAQMAGAVLCLPLLVVSGGQAGAL